MYLYFATKGAIFAALQAQGWEGLRDAVDEETAKATGACDTIVSDIIT